MKKALFLTSVLALLLLSGCARTVLKAPCPNYGNSCSKTPINSWDYQQQ